MCYSKQCRYFFIAQTIQNAKEVFNHELLNEAKPNVLSILKNLNKIFVYLIFMCTLFDKELYVSLLFLIKLVSFLYFQVSIFY